MSGFVASEAVDVLTYNFAPYGPQGEIPEPSSTQIQGFRNAIGEMFGSMLPEDMNDNDSAALAEKIREYISRDQTEMQEKILHACAAVCSDNPSYDVLHELPYRHQQAFVGWLSGILLTPKGLIADTSS